MPSQSISSSMGNIAKPLCYAGTALGQALFEAASIAIDDPFSLEDPTKFIKKLSKLSSILVNEIKENPKQIVAAAVEFLVPVGILKFSKLKNLPWIRTNIQAQKQFFKSLKVPLDTINKVTTPIKTFLHEAGETLKIGLEHGKDALRNVVRVIKGEPELASVGDIAPLQVSPKYFKDFIKIEIKQLLQFFLLTLELAQDFLSTSFLDIDKI